MQKTSLMGRFRICSSKALSESGNFQTGDQLLTFGSKHPVND